MKLRKNAELLPYLERWANKWVVSGWLPSTAEVIDELNKNFPLPEYNFDTASHYYEPLELIHNREVFINKRCNIAAAFAIEEAARMYASRLVKAGVNVLYVVSPESYRWSLDELVSKVPDGRAIRHLQWVADKIIYSEYL